MIGVSQTFPPQSGRTNESHFTAAFESAPSPSTAPKLSAVTSTLQSPTPVVTADNPWADSTDDLASAFSKPVAYPSLSTQPVLQPKPLSSNIHFLSTGGNTGRSTPSDILSAIPSTWQSPVTSPKVTDDWGEFGEGDMAPVEDKAKVAASASPASLAGLSKEAKAAEMARRREERKARIAQLKEQKKGGT
jgi:hypothetical protein